MRAYEPVERNLREAMRCFALGSAAGEIAELPGLFIANAAVDSPVFNAALLSEPVTGGRSELERLICAAGGYFERRGLCWSFWVCHDLLVSGARKAMNELFQGHGLWRAARCPGMVAECPPPAAKRIVSGLEFQPVDNADARISFARITSVCFRVPGATSLAIYGQPAAWTCGLQGWLGYLGDSAVATAATVTQDGATGLYSVATLPQFQRRGIGEQITRHALASAREQSGVSRTVLQATPQGLSLYRRLGFREVTRVTVFASN